MSGVDKGATLKGQALAVPATPASGRDASRCDPSRDAFGVPANLVGLATDVWQDFLDANPSDVNSPEEYPDHALVTFDEFVSMARTVIMSAEPLPPMMDHAEEAPQFIAGYITSTTEDGVWPFEVWQAWQRVFASGMQLRENSRSEVEAEGLQPDPKGTPTP